MVGKSLIIAGVFCSLFSLMPAAPSWAAPIPLKDAVVTVGVPQWAATVAKPMTLVIKQVDPANNTKTITTTVTINNLPAFVPPPIPLFIKPAPNIGETPVQYNIRVQGLYNTYVANNTAAYIAAWNVASAAKATTITAAINAKIGPGTATAGVNPADPAGYIYGKYTISNAQTVAYGKGSNTTGEVGDGLKFQNAPTGGGTSPYNYRSSMGSASGLTTSAAGTDPEGNSSIVEFGVSGVAIASWFPNSGDNIGTIMQGLADILDTNSTFISHDYSAIYSSISQTLTITGGPDGNFNDGTDETYFSLTDQNLDGELAVSFGNDAPEEVPEPASLSLLAVGSAALLLKRRRKPLA